MADFRKKNIVQTEFERKKSCKEIPDRELNSITTDLEKKNPYLNPTGP